MSLAKSEIQQFAEKHQLRVWRDDSGDAIIRGRFGHIYSHTNGEFGLMFKAPALDSSLDRQLKARRRIAIQAGFRLHQRGDVEAILLFNASDNTQAELAIKLVRAKRKRHSSPAQLGNLRRGPTEPQVQTLRALEGVPDEPHSEEADNHNKRRVLSAFEHSNTDPLGRSDERL